MEFDLLCFGDGVLAQLADGTSGLTCVNSFVCNLKEVVVASDDSLKSTWNGYGCF